MSFFCVDSKYDKKRLNWPFSFRFSEPEHVEDMFFVFEKNAKIWRMFNFLYILSSRIMGLGVFLYWFLKVVRLLSNVQKTFKEKKRDWSGEKRERKWETVPCYLSGHDWRLFLLMFQIEFTRLLIRRARERICKRNLKVFFLELSMFVFLYRWTYFFGEREGGKRRL